MKRSSGSSEFNDRAVRALGSPRNWLFSSLLLLPASYVALASGWRWATNYWVTALGYASQLVRVPMALAASHDDRAWLAPPSMGLEWTGRYPNKTLLLVTAITCVSAICASFVRKERWLPVAYLVRALAAVQLAICAYFFKVSDGFPYSAQAHMREILAIQMIGIKGIPILMLFAYYPLDFRLLQKAFATFLMLFYFAAIVPFFLTFHACIIFYGSLLFTPIAFFVMGAPLLFVLLLALYSYCVSWSGVIARQE